MHFRYGGLLCVFLSLWNSYRSLVHRGKEPSPNICVYRQMCDGGVGGLRHLFNLKKVFFFSAVRFLAAEICLTQSINEQSFCAIIANAFWSWILARLDRVRALRAQSFVKSSHQRNQTLQTITSRPYCHGFVMSLSHAPCAYQRMCCWSDITALFKAEANEI